MIKIATHPKWVKKLYWIPLILLCGTTGRVGSTRRRGLKGASPSCQLPPSRNDKTAARQRPGPFQPSRLNLRQARGPGGEEHVAPALQVYTVAA